MTKNELKVLEKLVKEPGLKGQKFLDYFIWMNTVKPKCKIGDCYEVTEYSHRIYGVQVIRFHGRISEIKMYPSEKTIGYVLTAMVKNGDKEKEFTLYAKERDLRVKVKDNLNVILGKPGEDGESIAVYI